MNLKINWLVIVLMIVFPLRVLAFIPNDPYFSKQWYLEKINAPRAWDLTLGKKEVVVAVLDVGVDVNHPDISFWRNIDEIPNNGIDDDNNGFIDDFYGWNFLENSGDVSPVSNKDVSNLTEEESKIVNHGTIISGIIAGIPNNKEGIAGISWKAKIMPIKIAGIDGYTNTKIISDAIIYAVDNGADVINISLTSTSSKVYDKNFQKAVEYAYKNNVLVVAAAGNGSKDINGNVGFNLDQNPVYPACFYDDLGDKIVLGVGSTTKDDKRSIFSNFGSKCIEVSAPGEYIFSTQFYIKGKKFYNSLYGGYWSGTSFSVPIVSGAAAFVKSIKPNISVNNLIYLLTITGDQIGVSGNYGIGPRINLDSLIRTVLDSTGEEEEPNIIVRKKNYKKFYIVQYKGLPQIKIFNEDNKLLNSFWVFNKWVKQGIHFVPIQVQNGLDLIAVSLSYGGKPIVRVFTESGILVSEFLAYDENFKGGVNITAADIDQDGNPEIITAPESHGGPHIRVFSIYGDLEAQFFIGNKSNHNGVQIFIDDVNNDGKLELITSLIEGQNIHFKIFNNKFKFIKDLIISKPDKIKQINFVSADVNNDNQKELIIASGKGGTPYIQIYNYQGKLLSKFLAYDKNFKGGVFVNVVDIDNDNILDIVTSPMGHGGPHIRIFNFNGQVKKQFFVFNKNNHNGVVIFIKHISTKNFL